MQLSKPNKYRAKKVIDADGTFDSQIEYRRWCELKIQQCTGLITDLERQIAFDLVVNGVRIGKYTADHRYTVKATGQRVVEDVKGAMARDVSLRLKLMKALHGIDVQLWPKRKRKRKARKGKAVRVKSK